MHDLAMQPTSIGGRVHGGEQAEGRVPRDGAHVPTLRQRHAAISVLQQPCYALQGLRARPVISAKVYVRC